MNDHVTANCFWTMLSFIVGESELAGRLRAFAWRGTSLGHPVGWPVSLKTLVSVMLGANQPMFIVWGPDRTLLYNDQYISVLQGHHPDASGRPFLEVWSEIADDLRPLVEDAYAGKPSHMNDILLMMERNGYLGGDALRLLLHAGPTRGRRRRRLLLRLHRDHRSSHGDPPDPGKRGPQPADLRQRDGLRHHRHRFGRAGDPLERGGLIASLAGAKKR